MKRYGNFMRKLMVLMLSIILTIIAVDYDKKAKTPAEPEKKGMKRQPAKND